MEVLIIIPILAGLYYGALLVTRRHCDQRTPDKLRARWRRLDEMERVPPEPGKIKKPTPNVER